MKRGFAGLILCFQLCAGAYEDRYYVCAVSRSGRMKRSSTGIVWQVYGSGVGSENRFDSLRIAAERVLMNRTIVTVGRRKKEASGC
jgi:hypothetical protein